MSGPADSILPNEPTVLPDAVEVRPAHSREELEQAFRLVYRSYLQRGYVQADPSEIRVTPYNALPDTITFVGVLEGTVIATVSLVPDSPLGLPMDAIYHRETQELRDQGRRVTEVSMLADRRLEIRRTLPMLLQLMKHVFDYATLVLKANDMCITINPRHESFYQRYLMFSEMGPERVYPSVQNNPALAKRLNLDTVRDDIRGIALLERVFYESRTPIEEFMRRYRMTSNDIHYFFFELTPTLRNASPDVIDVLRAELPLCPWDEWCPSLPD